MKTAAHTSELQAARRRTHGHADSRGRGLSPTYQSWKAMRLRCDRKEDIAFHHYGGRGITYCERWKRFENFLADMGERPLGRTLDRIDVNGDYEPGNCRWATQSEQMRNTRKHALKVEGTKP